MVSFRIPVVPILASFCILISAFTVHALPVERLCYSTKTRSVLSGDMFGFSALTQNQRHGLALSASALIYVLDDLETASSGQELLSKHAQFRSQIPAGYEFEHYMSNRSSGLKYMMLAPLDPANPWIFAFAGTQTTIDWMSDINLGSKQLARVEGMLYAFTNCEYTDREQRPLSGRDWIITGHSLGGGLAEAYSYQIQKRRIQQGLQPAHLELVTFNPFGALAVVEKNPANAAEVIQLLTTFNYFVTGDPVSQIGHHIGATFELPMATRPSGVSELIQRHSLNSVRRLVMRNEAANFSSARAAAPPHSTGLNTLQTFGKHFDFLPSAISDQINSRFTAAKVLEEASEILIARGLSQNSDREALKYISNMTLVYLKELSDIPSGGIMHDLLVKRLTIVQNRIAAAPNR